MMECKLWFKISPLLLLVLSALASGDQVSTVAPESPTAPSSESTPGTVPAEAVSGSSLEESGQVTASNNNTETSPSSGLKGTTEEETIPLISLKTSNGTFTTTSSEFINGTISATTTSLPTLENLNSTTELTAISTITLNSTKKNETSPVPTTPSRLETANTSQPNVSTHTDNNNTSTSKPTESTSSPVTTITSASTTTIASTTPESTAAKTKTTTSTTQVPSVSPVATHKAITPSQLNVGEDTTAVHEAPALDPLLAGLVSAFIIAAVIITLLLFLKLRRRDSRPEFRRLQDLPMDDMMEDTPLSMYSY